MQCMITVIACVYTAVRLFEAMHWLLLLGRAQTRGGSETRTLKVPTATRQLAIPYGTEKRAPDNAIRAAVVQALVYRVPKVHRG